MDNKYQEEISLEEQLYKIDGRMDVLKAKLGTFPAKVIREYREKLDTSWIFHDLALEGIVLTYAELKAAVDQRIISDVSLIPTYEDVKNQKIAMDFVRASSEAKKPPPITMDFVKQLYGILTPSEVEAGCPYREENPLHRHYYHEIAQPETIKKSMETLLQWCGSKDFKDAHPIQRAVEVQKRLISIYPWTQSSGKIGRLLTNYLLVKDGYLPAVIHSIERQRYYEVLRHDNHGLMNLVLESLGNAIETTTRFFNELSGIRSAG